MKKINWEKVNNLVPCIIQDSSTGLVLMLGYMNQEALTRTMKTGLVWFYSRTKKRRIAETIDLLYHLLVLLVNQNISLEEIESEIKKRQIKNKGRYQERLSFH